MSIELQSMKYFKNELDAAPAEAESAAVASASQAQIPSQATSPNPGRGSGWTKGLTVICVLFLLIAVTGSFGALFGFVGLFIEPMRADTSEMTYSRKQIVEEFEEAQIAARHKYFPVLLYMQLMKLGLAIGLGVSAVLMLQRKARGRSLAVAFCAMALVFHFASLGVGLMVANDGGSLTSFMSSAMDDAAAEQNLTAEQRAQGEALVKNAVFTGAIIGLSVGLLIKVAFYGFIIMHLIQPEVRRIFGEDPFAELACENGTAVPA